MQKTIACMPGLPLLGNLLDVRRDRLAFFGRVRERCGKIGSYRLPGRLMILITDPAYAHAVLVEHAHAVDQTRRFRTVLRPLLGQGILTSSGTSHQQQRRLIAPHFQHRRIVSYADMIVQYAETIAQGWSDGASVDIAQEMMRLTLSVIGQVLFEADLLTETQELGSAIW